MMRLIAAPWVRLLCLVSLLLLAAPGCRALEAVRQVEPAEARVYAGDARALADLLLTNLGAKGRRRARDLEVDEVTPDEDDGRIELRVYESTWTGQWLQFLVTLIPQSEGLILVELRRVETEESLPEYRAAQVWHWINGDLGPPIDSDALD